MKKFYYKYFYIPKHGKIKDNVMLIRTAVTAVMMVICLAVMSFTAYAYFSHNVTSASNRIQSANFDAKVSISIIEKTTKNSVEEAPQNSVEVKKVKSTCTAELKAGKTYDVTISYGESTASTGFCVITAQNCLETYHTQQLWKTPNPSEGKLSSITFSLKVSKDTTVEILSHWGTSSYLDAYQNGTIDPKLYIRDEVPVEITVSDEVIHDVKSGDTLSKIASQYGVTVDQIVANNDIADRNLIVPGQKLTIPSVEGLSTDSEKSNSPATSSKTTISSDFEKTTDTPEATDTSAPSTVSE